MKTLAICMFTILAAAGVASAGLKFKSTISEHDAEEGAKVVAGSFEFTNEGAQAVTIQNVDTSCRCLEAKADKLVYQPGESGVISAKFEIRGLTGEIEKSLTVYTDDPETPYVRLAVKIDVPVMVEIEPKMLTWAVGEETVTKPIVFRVMRDEPIRITKIDVSRKNFSGALKEIEAGKLYHIELTPESTADTMLGVVTIQTDCEIEEQARQLGFFRVQSAKDAAAEAEEAGEAE